MLVADLLKSATERFPHKEAAVFASSALSFGDLGHRSGAVAARLRRLGLGPGGRVAIISENSPAALVFYWGILKAGAVPVDIPCTAAAGVVRSILEECRPEAVVLSSRQLARMGDRHLAGALPSIILTDGEPPDGAGMVQTLGEIVAAEPSAGPPPDVAESDVAMILYTSGTTGRAKGVMLSHRNLISNLQAANDLMGLDSDERLLLVVPFFFIHGRMQILMHAMVGGTIVVSRGFQFPGEVVRELADHRVSSLSGVPYHFRMLLDRTDLKSTALPCLRSILVTGGALGPDELRDLSDALPGVGIHVAYGQTEASPRLTYLGPAEVLARPGSCGRPLPGVRIEIVNERGTAMPPGEIGEVVASGPNVMRGYVSQDERATGIVDDLGRLHTGDLGRIDRDGYLYLAGRLSEMIKTAGERVFPGEIERVIKACPGVLECAVTGTPHDLLGEMIVASVVPAPQGSIRVDDVRRHCLRELPFVRVPGEIRILPELPKTASGKIDRAALKEGFAAGCANPGGS